MHFVQAGAGDNGLALNPYLPELTFFGGTAVSFCSTCCIASMPSSFHICMYTVVQAGESEDGWLQSAIRCATCCAPLLSIPFHICMYNVMQAGEGEDGRLQSTIGSLLPAALHLFRSLVRIPFHMCMYSVTQTGEGEDGWLKSPIGSLSPAALLLCQFPFTCACTL